MSEQQEIEVQITPVVTSISRDTARLAFNFSMPGLVARLYLFLFGEFDKDVVEDAVKLIREHKKPMEQILNKEKTPLAVLYEFLIEKQYIEDQKLNDDAMLFINLPDSLQLRIADSPLTPEAEEIERDFSCTYIKPDDSESSECQ